MEKQCPCYFSKELYWDFLIKIIIIICLNLLKIIPWMSLLLN